MTLHRGKNIIIATFAFALLIVPSILGSYGCRKFSETSETETVKISMSPVRDQGSASLCWAYATAGFLEWAYNKRHGTPIDLSEEYFAYYRASESIYTTIQFSKTLLDFRARIQLVSLQLNHLRQDEGWQNLPMIGLAQQFGFTSQKNMFAIAAFYGAMPASAWNTSIYNASVSFKTAKTRVQSFVEQQGLDVAKKLSLAEVGQRFLVNQSGPFRSAPPTRFVFNGRNYTPSLFLQERLPIDFDNFETVSLGESAGKDSALKRVKNVLASGIPVPLLYINSFAALSDGRYRGDLLTPKAFASGFFAHVALVTDFVNRGGRAGALLGENARETLIENVNQPFSALEYLRIKNSWGYGVGPANRSATGYYDIDREYIEKVLMLSRLDPSGQSDFVFLVPKSASIWQK